MNYERIYNNLIERAKSRNITNTYYERHHIIPRCLGGTNEACNLVNLTPEEHYLAHQLLVKMHPDHYGLIYAAILMCAGRPSNKIYGWTRKRFSRLQSLNFKNGASPTQNKRWISNEKETILVERDIAKPLIDSGSYIAGKKALRAPCGHLVRETCVPCSTKKQDCLKRRHDAASKLAHELYDQFMNSQYDSITEFAKHNNTSQPRLTMLWKKYVTEYSEKSMHGKGFKITS